MLIQGDYMNEELYNERYRNLVSEIEGIKREQKEKHNFLKVAKLVKTTQFFTFYEGFLVKKARKGGFSYCAIPW